MRGRVKKTYFIKGIENMKISIDSAMCDVEILRHSQDGHGSSIDGGGPTRGGPTTVRSKRGPPCTYFLHICCSTVRNENPKPKTFVGYTGIYTKCTIKVSV